MALVPVDHDPFAAPSPASPPGMNPNAPVRTPPPSFSGPSTVRQAEQQQTGGDASARFRDITNEGLKARDQQAILATMQNDLERFRSGPGADYSLFAKKLAQTFAHVPTFGVDLWTPYRDSVAAQESFRKLSNQLADAPNTGSDARLQVNQASNPNDTLSPEGNDFILRMYRGNADYKLARARLAAQYPDKSDPRGFEDKVGSKLDPRYYQFNRLTGPQQREYLHGIKNPGELKSFTRGYENAKNAGYLEFDNGGQ